MLNQYKPKCRNDARQENQHVEQNALDKDRDLRNRSFSGRCWQRLENCKQFDQSKDILFKKNSNTMKRELPSVRLVLIGVILGAVPSASGSSHDVAWTFGNFGDFALLAADWLRDAQR